MAKVKKPRVQDAAESTASYAHPEARALIRPEVGVQPLFKKRQAPVTYRYDSSLSPELHWDGQNPQRELAESLIRAMGEAGKELAELALQPASKQRDARIHDLRQALTDAESRLRRLSGPFLNWTGKAERLSFEVPTVPLFIHERLSTQGIIETLRGHRSNKQGEFLGDLFASSKMDAIEQATEAYEHLNGWTNRMILGDSLVVMNSLLKFESLGGQVQMIYIDPPYGVKFGSNFQPFVRKRDVKNNEDESFTREPEMVQAYRDTWELGLHSYLTYLRDRLLLSRDLLADSGSIFVQISDENAHHVRELMDEVFGAENFFGQIPFITTSSQTAEGIGSVADYLLWFTKNKEDIKYNQIYLQKDPRATGGWGFNYIEEPDGTRRPLSREERCGDKDLPPGKIYRLDNLTSQGATPSGSIKFDFDGKSYNPGARNHWKTTIEGMKSLAQARRIQATANQIQYVRFFNDFSVQPLTNLWLDTTQAGFVDEKNYVVQTVSKVIERCMLMCTDPGDLVLDPTCGSGTTAYVAEQWGRRWITIDTSRVPLALARQRLLTATFDYYDLKDPARGPAGGFVYIRKQNKKGDEIGGLVPHITLGSIANNEPPKMEVLVDRPEVSNKKLTRVSGPFAFEAVIPSAEALDEDPEKPGIQNEGHHAFVDRMLDVLRRSPDLRLPGNQIVRLRNIRIPAKTLTLSAEAMVDAPSMTDLAAEAEGTGNLIKNHRPVAILFGPEGGPLTERFVREAWDEAQMKRYTHLYVIGFGIEPRAHEFLSKCGKVSETPATYLSASMDLQMGDLLKNMRSSQIFSVTGLPDIKIHAKGKKTEREYQVEILGLDTFDPITMEPIGLKGDDLPAWFLDTNYNGMCFHVTQAFFPRTSAWENLKRSMKAQFDESLWEHLSGTTSAPFPAGTEGQIAVKVIDDRGNELIAVRKLEE